MVLNNPDGYGFCIPDGNGRLYVEKAVDYDMDVLYKKLTEDYKSDPLQLHLRYTTAGATSTRNLHPFPVLEYDTDGVDLRMAHNGTIQSYKHAANSLYSWESDTRNFVRTFVRPLFKRLIRGMAIEQIMTDPFIEQILDEKVPYASVLSFMDGYGNTLEINPLGNGGKYLEGMWVSNTYSFDPKHREPTKTYNVGYQATRQSSSYDSDDRWEDWYKNQSVAGVVGSETQEFGKDSMQEKFSEKYEVDEDELVLMSDETLQAIFDDEPEDILLLVKELLAIQYESKHIMQRQEREIRAMDETIIKYKEKQDDKAA
jgi:hypothetical protein